MDTIDTTLVAAVIAACAALAAAVFGVLNAARARRVERRKHVWDRLRWAIDADSAYDIRRAVLEALFFVPWVEERDQALAQKILRLLEEERACAFPRGNR